MRVQFTVWGKPVPKGRHRLDRRSNRGAGHMHATRRTDRAEASIGMRALEEWRHEPAVGPLWLGVQVYRHTKKRPPYNQPIGRSDFDNIVKSVMDAMNKVVYNDDRQIVGFLESGSWWAPTPADERIEIVVASPDERH